ncbi:MAG: prephenate dehydratase, partial [Alphaproteobacteria bacterium]
MKKIAFQGELGANSHIACREVYPDFEPLPCATFEDAFAAAAS